MITVECPMCHLLLKIPDQYAGTEGMCKNCRATISVPDFEKPSVPTTHLESPNNVEDLYASHLSPMKGHSGKRVLFLYAIAMTIVATVLSMMIIFRLSDSNKTNNSSSKPAVTIQNTTQSKPVSNATNIPNTPAVVSPPEPLPPELYEAEVYQVSKPTKYEWRHPSTGRYSSYSDSKLPVNGYFTVIKKDGDYYQVSISDGLNTYDCRIEATDLENQKLTHIDKITLAKWRKEQDEATMREYERLAAAERKRQLDEAHAIALEDAAYAQEEKAYAEAEAAQAQQEKAQAEADALRAQGYSAQIQAQSAQAQAYAAQAQAEAISRAQAEQSYLNQQEDRLNQQRYNINRRVLQNLR